MSEGATPGRGEGIESRKDQVTVKSTQLCAGMRTACLEHTSNRTRQPWPLIPQFPVWFGGTKMFLLEAGAPR